MTIEVSPTERHILLLASLFYRRSLLAKLRRSLPDSDHLQAALTAIEGAVTAVFKARDTIP